MKTRKEWRRLSAACCLPPKDNFDHQDESDRISYSVKSCFSCKEGRSSALIKDLRAKTRSATGGAARLEKSARCGGRSARAVEASARRTEQPRKARRDDRSAAKHFPKSITIRELCKIRETIPVISSKVKTETEKIHSCILIAFG